MIFTKINCLRHAFRVVGNQERRGGKDNGEAKTMGGKDNGEAKTTGAEGGSRRLTDEVSIMLISSPVGVGTENYDKTKLTSRKTSEFHYISLVRKGADYLP